MGFLIDNCTLVEFSGETLASCDYFDCGHPDLNDFFFNDVVNYKNALLGKSYCFTLDENPKIIVCAFTVSNDSIKTNTLPKARKRKIRDIFPRQKQFHSYPAVLIGRLGVHKDYRTPEGIESTTGNQLMDFIKDWFTNNNKTGCRFIVVDSYNYQKALDYYARNGFIPLFSNEEQEKSYFDYSQDRPLKSRLLYFDLADYQSIDIPE